MPAAISALKRVPWKRVWIAAMWLFNQGRSRLEKNLSTRERDELWKLMKLSKGVPTNLSARQRDRFRELVTRGIRGR